MIEFICRASHIIKSKVKANYPCNQKNVLTDLETSDGYHTELQLRFFQSDSDKFRLRIRQMASIVDHRQLRELENRGRQCCPRLLAFFPQKLNIAICIRRTDLSGPAIFFGKPYNQISFSSFLVTLSAPYFIENALFVHDHSRLRGIKF